MRMLQALNSTLSSSSSKLFVSRSTVVPIFHLSFSSNSKKMEGHRTPHAVRDTLNSRSGHQSASLVKSSLNSKVGQSSSPSLSPRSRSPQSVENQRMKTPKKTTGVSPERGPGSESKEGPFDICKPAIEGPAKLKKSLHALNKEKGRALTRPPVQYVRRGMVLLTNFIDHMDQASLVKSSLNNKVGQSSSPSLSPRSRSPQSVENQRMKTLNTTTSVSPESGPGSESKEGPFDICKPAIEGPVKLKKSLLEKGKEKRRALSRPPEQYLRPGMVLLTNFISHMDQVKVVNLCRELGVGSGGFYRPGYRDGAKLHLHMMCLGKDWNPESRSYGNSRSSDGAVPPEIPEELRKLVDEALNASHKFLLEKQKNVEEIPNMSPDICIVNFYSNSGRLGLHQDRDESEESLKKGLPVVSFSIGDSAEFLYSDARDVDKAEKVTLESGDVLIFGGDSRHIFHGVSSIEPKTAPSILTDKTNLKPGRLNLTFRQY